jgi:hypothetical protein
MILWICYENEYTMEEPLIICTTLKLVKKWFNSQKKFKSVIVKECVSNRELGQKEFIKLNKQDPIIHPYTQSFESMKNVHVNLAVGSVWRNGEDVQHPWTSLRGQL